MNKESLMKAIDVYKEQMRMAQRETQLEYQKRYEEYLNEVVRAKPGSITHTPPGGGHSHPLYPGSHSHTWPYPDSNTHTWEDMRDEYIRILTNLMNKYEVENIEDLENEIISSVIKFIKENPDIIKEE